MITINAEEFELLLPFVGSATTQVFDAMTREFEWVYDDIVTFIISEDVAANYTELDEKLQAAIKDLVILESFINKLRSHDLVMTDTGFGVVSNEQYAPASTTRVDSLMNELLFIRDKRKVFVINKLRQVKGWAKTTQAERCIPNLMWSPRLLEQYSSLGNRLTYADLKACSGMITEADIFLRRHLGEAMIDRLLTDERECGQDQSHNHAIHLMRVLTGMRIDNKDIRNSYERVANYIEANIESFEEYKDSNEYKANHMERYENKIEDPTYFW